LSKSTMILKSARSPYGIEAQIDLLDPCRDFGDAIGRSSGSQTNRY